MSARILDGKELAARLRSDLRERAAVVKARQGRPPGLGAVLVGDDPASAVYVRNKEKAAREVGLHSEIVRLPAGVSEAVLLAEVDKLNARRDIHGFLVQLPLPEGLDEARVIERIAPEKDADGLHPTNLGRLMADLPAPQPCTPSGVMALLDAGGVKLEGARAVVVGRSAIVGKPVALMLLARNATVTLCHSRTRDLADEVRRAQVVVAAVGKPRLIRGDWISAGAAVIDVGINRVEGKLVGDVEFEAAKERAAVITPVPGGVGPLTVAMLIRNTIDLALRAS